MTPTGSYDATLATGVFGFLPSASKTDNFRVLNFGCTTNCPTPNPPTITGEKCYDLNLNGVCDPGEPLLAAWKITSTDPTSSIATTFTGTDGVYSFVVSPTTLYTIAETLPNSSWLNTSALSGNVTSGGNGTDTAGPNFANVCIGAGGGLTLGFWSNKNGQKALNNNSPAWYQLLDNLNLHTNASTPYDPGSSTSAFSSWLLSATATDMNYMLSAQLATMELNVNVGFANVKVDPSALVYAPGVTGANTAGFISISALMTEANNALGSGTATRAYEQILETALDSANNNLIFFQTTPCAYSF
jgi:hypothetical protein